LLYLLVFSDEKPIQATSNKASPCVSAVKPASCVSAVKTDTCVCCSYCDDTSDSNKHIFANPEMIKCAVSQQLPVFGIGSCAFKRANPSSPCLEPQYIRVVKQAVLGIIYTDWEGHTDGNTWPAGETGATTMIGLCRLDNLQFLLEEAIRLDVPGDFIETGIWCGGATILAAAIFQAFGQTCPSSEMEEEQSSCNTNFSKNHFSKTHSLF
jgi:hypothetical protein